MIKAWHFTGSTLRDGRPVPPVGTVLRYEGPISICGSGLHASLDPFDALWYAPGPILHSVECDEIVDSHDDKFVCRARTIVASKDMAPQLRRFACDEALRVLPSDAPDIVWQYLVSADESLRQAARRVAWAEWDAARKAAARAAWGAVRAATKAASRDAAWGAAWVAAQDAPTAAVWAVARDASRRRFNEMVMAEWGMRQHENQTY